MKRILLLIICGVLIVSLGCACRRSPELLRESSFVTEISIVEVGAYVEMADGITIQDSTALVKIEDTEEFMQKLKNLKWYNRIDCNVRGTPQGTIAVKILYSDNSFEYISWLGRATWDGTLYREYAGHYSMNQEEFENLINSYMVLE